MFAAFRIIYSEADCEYPLDSFIEKRKIMGVLNIVLLSLIHIYMCIRDSRYPHAGFLIFHQNILRNSRTFLAKHNKTVILILYICISPVSYTHLLYPGCGKCLL